MFLFIKLHCQKLAYAKHAYDNAVLPPNHHDEHKKQLPVKFFTTGQSCKQASF